MYSNIRLQETVEKYMEKIKQKLSAGETVPGVNASGKSRGELGRSESGRHL